MVIMVTGMALIDQDPAPQRMTATDFDQEWGVTITQQGNLGNLEEAIISGEAITVSDGSFQDSNGSAAWTVEGRNHNHHILGGLQENWTTKALTEANFLDCGESLE